MISIRDIVQQALTTGCLTQEAEARLRVLLQHTEYGLEDLRAFMRLQRAVMDGQVRQESRQLASAASS
ncbi:hypothetical protein [Oscillatoria sp. FACHB-1406]|uniref:hypothetical protein n=1 Tax=Oscillatoria sp. FACHB-1406 TaxID=2692846 RepID=UPI0016858051|nr:hypothetical protein [Oscillatoria sp. FACHB-1406]MBD2576130.1 hypothetical protein [Oscillatoria sp. FACHB-1406]